MGDGFEKSGDKERPPIPFEDFLLSSGSTNNFFLHFVPGEFGDSYRSATHYQSFLKENPELHEKLLHVFDYMNVETPPVIMPGATQKDWDRVRESADKKLRAFNENKHTFYAAYLLMRKHVKDDARLFS